MEQPKENNQSTNTKHQILLESLDALIKMNEKISKELASITSKTNPPEGQDIKDLTPEEKENEITCRVMNAVLTAAIDTVRGFMTDSDGHPSPITCCAEYLHGSIIKQIVMKDMSEMDECLECCEDTIDSIISMIPTFVVAITMAAFNSYDAIIKEQWNEKIRQLMDFIILIKADVDAHTNMINSLKKDLDSFKK